MAETLQIKRPSQLIAGTRCDAPALLSQVYGTDYQAWRQLREPLTAWSDVTVRQLGEIAHEGQALMNLRHGSGFPNFHFMPEAKGSIRNLASNNGRHVADFAEDAEILGQYLGRSLAERQAYQPAAKMHDSVQTIVIQGLPRTGEDERESALEMLTMMRKQNVTIAAAEIATYVIQATQLLTNEQGRILGQHGAVTPDDYYPSEAAMMAARIGASADLARLYDKKGVYNGHMLFLQRMGYDPDPTVQLTDSELNKLIQHLADQHMFMADHRYPLPEAELLFGHQRSVIVGYAGFLALEGERGNITSMAQLFDLDARFESNPGGFLKSARVFA